MKLPKELQKKVKKEKIIKKRFTTNDNFQWDFIYDILRQYNKKLQTKWRIDIIVDQDKDFENESYPEDKHHEIFLLPDTVKNFKSDPLNLVKFAHELCHLRLAERIDPVFSTLIFSKEYGPDPHAQKKEKFELLKYAWRIVIEFWVDDLLYKTWPQMAKIDHEDIIKMFKQNVQNLDLIKRKINWTYSPDTEFFIGYAGEIARDIVLTERFNLEPFDYSQIIYSFGDEFVALTNNLIEFYKSNYFQQLNYDKKEDLMLLFESVKRALEIYDFPIKPRLIKEDGLYVWKVE